MDVLSKTWIFLCLSMICQTKKHPLFQQRMPVEVRLRLPVLLREWKPEAKFFFWMKILLPPTLWCGIPSCRKSSPAKRNRSRRFWIEPAPCTKMPESPRFWLPEVPVHFFHIADTIIQMDCYHPVDITDKVRELCGKYPLNPVNTPSFTIPASHRIMQKNTPTVRSQGHGAGKTDRLKIKVHGKDGFLLGKQEVDLRYVEQIVDSEQTAALGTALKICS